MSGATDSGMVKTMGIVMGSVGVIALLCVLAARLLGSESDYDDPMKRNALVQRIQPLAAVRTSADDLVVAEAAAAPAGGAAKTGEEIANGACAACHIAGVAGAPKFGDEEAWAARRELGLDALVASVINGKGAMPARGGSPYTDDEIRSAVQYMAMFEGGDDTATDDAADEEAPAASDDDTAEAVAEEAPEVESAATEAVTEEAPETESAEADTGDASDDESAAADESANAVAASALVVGQVPDGLTDNIKSTVDGICASCHIAGVAGAPKNGDKVAWQERADKGLEALTASVVSGLNVMPPRGGSALTDEEIAIAIQYLMSK